MAKNLKLQTIKDFRGGLNLRADPFELAPNESPDLLNMDIDPRGGVEQRRGIKEMPVTVGNPNLFTVDESTAETSGAVMTNLTRNVPGATPSPFVANGCTTSWKLTILAAGTVLSGVDRMIPVLPSTKYSGTAFVKGSPARSHTMKFEWYTAASVLISTSSSVPVSNTNDPAPATLYFPAVRMAMTATSPATAAFVKVVYSTAAATLTDTIYVGGLYFAKGQNDGGYLRPEITTQFDSHVQSIWRYETAAGVVQTLVGTALSVWVSTDLLAWEQINYSPYGNFSEAIQFKDKLYIFNVSDYTRTWDGTSTGIITTQAFNDDLATSTGSNMVFSAASAVFQGCMWLGNTNESSSPVRTPNRVRWSHPNFPEAYRSFDFIDVDTGEDGDFITALVPFGDKLLVFKQRSLYAIAGTGPENFTVYPISTEVGAMHRLSIAPSAHGIYFFSWPDGVFLYDGKGLDWKFAKLKSLIDNGNIGTFDRQDIRLGWSGRRLWLACNYKVNPNDPNFQGNNRCFVMDPSLGKEGAWTAYAVSVSVMRSVPSASGPNLFLGGSGWSYATAEYLQVLEDPANLTVVDQKADGTVLHINSYFTTPWLDQGAPTQKKRYRTPEFVLRTIDVVSTLPVELRIDFHDSIIKRFFNLYTKQDPNVLTWGSGVWGDNWQIRTTRQSEIARGSPLGQARSIQLKISGPLTNEHWGLNAMTIKYVPRPPRN